MSNFKKVLIIDDLKLFHQLTIDTLADELKAGKIQFLSAFTLEEGQKLFDANRSDIDLIAVDACVPGDRPNSMELIRNIRKKFEGPIVAISSLSDYRELLMKAGCDYECKKTELFLEILEILAL